MIIMMTTAVMFIITLPVHPDFFLHLSQFEPCHPLSQLENVAKIHKFKITEDKITEFKPIKTKSIFEIIH